MTDEIQNNIKQIGSIAEGGKIYIEDYVMTFFKYMEEKNEGKSLVFILLGNVKKIDGEEILFISGAVEADSPEKFGSIEVFSAKDREEIEKKRVLYFDGLDVAGWCCVQPGYGDFLNTDHTTYHLDNFKKPFQVLYITDPTDDSRSFFRKAENGPVLKPVSGYIIYYDKNEPMHEYLLAVKKEASAAEKPKENLTENVDSFINSTLRRRRRKVNRRISLKDLFTAEKTEKDEEDEKKPSNLTGSLSFALLFVTLIIGGGLLKSNSRIEYLEKQVNSLGKSYISLRDDVTQSQEVFADNSRDSVPEASSAEAQTPGSVPAPAENKISYREYTVKPGDTLIYLSRYFYGTEDKVSDIMAANNMTEADMLIEGKTIKIPQ